MRRLNPAERLESRQLLAAVVGFDDVDGDRVTVTTSLGRDADLEAILKISSGQLQAINLGQNKAVFAGTALAVTVVRGPRGDGLVAVGEIAAEGIDLGTISIKGDLGSLAAGDATVATPGVASLSVNTLGRYGLATGATTLRSRITGPIGSVAVTRDVQEAAIIVEEGGIGSIKLGGSLIGGTLERSGSIVCSGNIGTVTVRGSLVGNAGTDSGRIEALSGSIGVTKISGSILGGGGEGSGGIKAAGRISSITVQREVIGGSGTESGQIRTANSLASVTIGRNLKGGGGNASGTIAAGGNLDKLAIGGSIIGGEGQFSGFVTAIELPRLTVQGSLIGGSGFRSAIVFCGRIDQMVIKGSIIGAGGGSARIDVGKIGSLDVGGELVGGFQAESGLIAAGSGISKVTIRRGITGGDEQTTGTIFSAGGSIGAVTIGRNLLGGKGKFSGNVSAPSIGTVTINGSLVGGDGEQSGMISAAEGIDAITIQRHLIGGRGIVSGSIRSADASIGAIRIGGNVLGGTGLGGASVSARRELTSLSVRGSMIGENLRPIQIAAGGANGTPAIGTVTVGGTVRDTLVLAGYVMDTTNGESGTVPGTSGSLGAVTIGGSLERSSIVGGIGNDLGRFANDQDTPISGVTDSSIGSVVIGGQAIGSNDPTRHFGITSRKIGSVVVGGKSQTIPVAIPPNGGFTKLGISPNVDIHAVS